MFVDKIWIGQRTYEFESKIGEESEVFFFKNNLGDKIEFARGGRPFLKSRDCCNTRQAVYAQPSRWNDLLKKRARES